jgi:hypothetical protein
VRYHGSENVGVTVIKFPGGGRQPPPEPPEVHLGEAIETAVEVHDLIVEGLRCHSFVDSPEGLKTILPAALSDLFGPEYVRWAETQFELIYTVDPYTFIDHLISYKTDT